MAMIGAAAASDQLQIGQRWQQFRVIVGELGDIADIDRRGCIEIQVPLRTRLAVSAAAIVDSAARCRLSSGGQH